MVVRAEPPARPWRFFLRHTEFKAMLTVLEVKEKRADLEAQMNAIETVAKEDNRDLTADETAELKILCGSFEELSETLKLAERREKIAGEIALQRSQSATNPQPPAGQSVHHVPTGTTGQELLAGNPGNTVRIDVVPGIRKSQLQCYDTPEEAYCAGMWFRAALQRDPQAIQFCRDKGNFVQGGLGFGESQMNAGQAIMIGGEVMNSNGQTKDVPSQGGYLVPVLVSRRLLDVRDRVGVFRECAQMYPLTGSDDEDYPKDDSNLVVYGKAELANIPASGLSFSSVQLRAKDKYTLTPVSNTLLRNRPDFAGDLMTQRIAHAFAAQIDREYINGNGVDSAPYYGITGLQSALGAAGKITATGATDWTTITNAHIRSLKAALADKFFTVNTRWLCSRAFFNVAIEPLIEARGGSKADMEGATNLSYQGFPVSITDSMPTAFAASSVPLLFGDFSASSVFGDRESIAVASSEHVYFHQDAVAVRGRTAYDIKVHRGGDGSNVGGYVGLMMPSS